MLSHRILAVFAAFAALSGSIRPASAAQAYIIVDSKTGYVLESHEPKQKRQIGSLTKIATAMVALDWAEHNGGNLGQVVSIPPAAFVGLSENNIGFEPGDN